MALAVPVRDAVLDVIEPGGEVKAFAPVEVGAQGGVEEGAVDGDFVQRALGLAVDGFGVGAAAGPEVVDAVPLLAGAAVDEVRCWVEGCETAAVEPGV